MKFVSTSGRSPAVDLRTALLQGLAPDGGLYLPSPLEPASAATIAGLKHRPFAEVARTIGQHVLGGALEPGTLDRLTAEAFDFPVPVVPLGPRTYVLELFHGPTLAFKDFGARFMARLLSELNGVGDRPLTILVATSGDTGGAVAHAFHRVPGTEVVVLYPHGRVSATQERQFTTLGDNVRALAVDGVFDDCQRLVKEAFGDAGLNGALRLTSANSINIGRLVAQIFYYFFARSELPGADAEVVVSVPSGNFGNLTAGLMAKRLGLPVTRFVAATNRNDVVPAYLECGRFEPRASTPTISSAMDVGNPSNLARITALYGGDLDRLKRDVIGSAHTDDATRACIADVAGRYGYVLDPHSAVGYLGLQRALAEHPSATGVFLATAHPAKFAAIVEAVIGRPVSIPQRLAVCLGREPVVERIGPDLRELRDVLLV
ncbi:MAG: threonine synthase [Gemmatimonadetes bacterium RBG_16_66_8]|nr:MAG: threonine synthase [Gemmatimonadetes bacterium RBG_16_66_8]